MLTAAMVLAVGLVVAAAGRSGAPASPGRRLRRIAIPIAGPSDSPRPDSTRKVLRGLRFWLAAGGAAAAVAGFGGAFGLALAAIVAAGLVVVLGREPPAAIAAPDEVALVLELVAGCLDAGLSVVDALGAGRQAARDVVLAAACDSTVAALRRGDLPDQAWSSWLKDPVLAPFGRSAARATHSGAAFADELRRSAARVRSGRRTSVRRRVQRVSVWVALPLGLCFLPAFVCVAVIPTVVGLFPALH